MAIEQGLHDDCGKKRKFVSVNLADTKHKNRVVSFLKRKHPLSGKFYYDLKAKWTSDRNHPTMMLTKRQVLALSSALAELVESKRPERKNKKKSPSI